MYFQLFCATFVAVIPPQACMPEVSALNWLFQVVVAIHVQASHQLPWARIALELVLARLKGLRLGCHWVVFALIPSLMREAAQLFSSKPMQYESGFSRK